MLIGMEGWIIETYFNDGGLFIESSLYDDCPLKLDLLWLPVVLEHLVMYVYLIRRWMRQWNIKMSDSLKGET